MKPTAREREAIAERIASIVLNMQPDPFQDPVRQCAKEILPVLLAAERAAAERMKERCKQEVMKLDNAHRSWDNDEFLAAAEAIRALPLEDPDGD